ncbi:hypothetical protein ZHAS_00000869 [Anopheles sinensis]|uniref:Uncharacterized protein n=1 Tax=Anopheles sinensis TaxID=74873 RepID=A0A084VAJ3_ANOSI|nr:hypothetical protein ZHAS_00000869 [Anopheles sinensis]
MTECFFSWEKRHRCSIQHQPVHCNFRSNKRDKVSRLGEIARIFRNANTTDEGHEDQIIVMFARQSRGEIALTYCTSNEEMGPHTHLQREENGRKRPVNTFKRRCEKRC